MEQVKRFKSNHVTHCVRVVLHAARVTGDKCIPCVIVSVLQTNEVWVDWEAATS